MHVNAAVFPAKVLLDGPTRALTPKHTLWGQHAAEWVHLGVTISQFSSHTHTHRHDKKKKKMETQQYPVNVAAANPQSISTGANIHNHTKPSGLKRGNALLFQDLTK